MVLVSASKLTDTPGSCHRGEQLRTQLGAWSRGGRGRRTVKSKLTPVLGECPGLTGHCRGLIETTRTAEALLRGPASGKPGLSGAQRPLAGEVGTLGTAGSCQEHSPVERVRAVAPPPAQL